MSDSGETAHVPPTRKFGTEVLHHSHAPLGVSLVEFWQWAYSDLVSNTTRGVLAEFVVATAIGAPPAVRNPWQAFDLMTPTGITIEVKSSAFVQSWQQHHVSKPVFAIAPSRSPAQVYVFCLLTSLDRPVDPLDVGEWEFFVVATAQLNRELAGRKSISLPLLRRLCPGRCGYDDLLTNIERAAHRDSD
jgi:hypothetical protein